MLWDVTNVADRPIAVTRATELKVRQAAVSRRNILNIRSDFPVTSGRLRAVNVQLISPILVD